MSSKQISQSKAKEHQRKEAEIEEEIEDGEDEIEQNDSSNQEEQEREDEEGVQEEEQEDKQMQNQPEEDDLIDNEEEGFTLPTLDIGEINIRIQKITDILSDFASKKEAGKTRNSYINELKQLIIKYYEYNEDICNLIMNMFAPNEAVAFMEANNNQRVVTIRTNSLKTKRRELAKSLIQRGVNLDPLSEWSKVGLKIFDSQVPIGATPEYLAGHYMLQSASSFLPVLALDPQPKEKILDMCAAPGGKTTYIAQLMKNTGILVANELKSERLKSLFFNIHRLGIKNTVITNYDGKKLSKIYSSFDRVLLDAPCSGLGVISKDQSIKLNRTYKDILNNSRIQKELVLAAIDSCNVKGSSDGIIVYSTCSIAVEENEWVVDYALKQRYVKCIELGFVSDVGTPGFVSYREKHFHSSLKNTRRIYPHVDNMDGFFVAKLRKYADGSKLEKIKSTETANKSKTKKNKNKKKSLNKDKVEEKDKGEEEDDDGDGEGEGAVDDAVIQLDEEINPEEDKNEEEGDERIVKNKKKDKKAKKDGSKAKKGGNIPIKQEISKEADIPQTFLKKKRKNP